MDLTLVAYYIRFGIMDDSSETRFKLTLQYDGGAFHGWQLQPDAATVQGAIEEAAARLAGDAGARRRPVAGAGRTDAGVHATGQVAALTMPPRWSALELVRALNALLPGTIRVIDCEAVPRGFDPRRDAVERSYLYRVGAGPDAASPFHRRWCWPLGRPLDLDAAARAAAHLPGEHDFRAFAKAGQPERGYHCRIARAEWRPWDDLGVAFEVSANRFLHRMVRYLVGTMVDIARGRRDPADMVRLLQPTPGSGPPETGAPEDPGGAAVSAAHTTSPPAPPRGLFLTGVRYGTGPPPEAERP